MRPKKIVLPSRADSALSGTASTVRPSRYSTRVPLVECRSVTHTPSSSGKIAACVLDTERVGSSRATRSAPG